jgi:hypothetical protein
MDRAVAARTYYVRSPTYGNQCHGPVTSILDLKTQQTCLSHETRTIRTRRLYTHLKAEVYLRVHACVYTQPIYAYVNGIVIKS